MAEISWELLESQVEACRMCGLCEHIQHKVPGQGDHHSPLMFIGEGPGQVEDEQGLAFVGPAGQLLTRMLLAIDLPRDRVYICNVVKCRPPNNRVPEPQEAAACMLHLRMQVALVHPLDVHDIAVTLNADSRVLRSHWFVRENGTLLESSRGLSGIDEIKQLFGATTLTVDTGADNAAGKLTFNIDGLARVIAPLRDACHWAGE